jgi:hypothetical protein
MILPSEVGLRYNDMAICPGAQTERRGLAGRTDFKSVPHTGPGRNLLGGETSPAAFLESNEAI